MSERVRAAAGALGVLVLTAAWVGAGLWTDGFDPVRQSISQLQRDGTATGALMTAAFVAFAVGGVLVSPVLGRRVGAAPQVALLLVCATTLGAAVSPLGAVRGGPQDAVHLALGATGYLSLSLLPLLAGALLRGRARALSWALGAVAAGCLLGTVPADAASGALQRVGFLAGHLWLLGFCLVVLVRPQDAGRATAASPTRSCAPDPGSGPRARRRRTPASPR